MTRDRARGAEQGSRARRAQAKGSLRKLGVEQIDLWQLHRIDPRVPRDEQFGAVRRLLPIPGTIRVAHLEENVAAAGLTLTSGEIAELDAAA